MPTTRSRESRPDLHSELPLSEQTWNVPAAPEVFLGGFESPFPLDVFLEIALFPRILPIRLI
jgi:hypothetical protein